MATEQAPLAGVDSWRIAPRCRHPRRRLGNPAALCRGRHGVAGRVSMARSTGPEKKLNSLWPALAAADC
jgi:hypothetical protein